MTKIPHRSPMALALAGVAMAMAVSPQHMQALAEAEKREARRRQLAAIGMTEEEYAAYCNAKGGPLTGEELRSVIEQRARENPPNEMLQPPAKTPQTQRLKMVDDAGIANINRSREERRRINAARYERSMKAHGGKMRKARITRHQVSDA